MISAKYRFMRSNSPKVFLSTNRASTDALNALSEWEVMDKKWSSEVEIDDDDKLIAVLTFGDNDSDRAGVDLETACNKHGVIREYISK